jgi:hypothetical protein
MTRNRVEAPQEKNVIWGFIGGCFLNDDGIFVLLLSILVKRLSFSRLDRGSTWL